MRRSRSASRRLVSSFDMRSVSFCFFLLAVLAVLAMTSLASQSPAQSYDQGCEDEREQ